MARVERTAPVTRDEQFEIATPAKKRFFNYDFAAAFAGVQNANIPNGLSHTVFGGSSSTNTTSTRASN